MVSSNPRHRPLWARNFRLVLMTLVLCGIRSGISWSLAGLAQQTRTAQRQPGSSAVLNQAKKLIQNGDPQGALALLQRADLSASDAADIHTMKGICFAVLGKPVESAAEFDQAIHFTKLPYMRFILAYDPAPVLGEVRVPVLALSGSKDLVVPPDLNLPALRKALTRDPDVTVVEFPGLNHFFQHAKTGSPREFAEIEETLAPEVLSLTSHWILEHTR